MIDILVEKYYWFPISGVQTFKSIRIHHTFFLNIAMDVDRNVSHGYSRKENSLFTHTPAYINYVL